MLHDSSELEFQKNESEIIRRRFGWIRPLIVYSLLIAGAFIGAYILLYLTAELLYLTVGRLTNYMSKNTVTVLFGFLQYGYMLAIVLLGTRWVLKQRVDGKLLGIASLPRPLDLPIAAVAWVVYIVVASVVLSFLTNIIDTEQVQNVGISNLLPGVELYTAFALLVLVGPFIEELVFRGYLYGQFQRVGAPVVLRIFVVSALFGVAHMQWNVGIGVFILSVIMCMLREWRGSIWPTILMHMIVNGMAFYQLYIMH